MAPLRTLTLYSGNAAIPIDYTDDTDWTQAEFASMGNLGEASAGQWLLRDEGGVLPDYKTRKFAAGHNVVVATVGSNVLFRGRVASQNQFRGRQKAGRAVEINFTLEDQNSHLRGIVVAGWVRPSETDAARAQGLVASYLSGSPRATTNLNGSNLIVTGSNAIVLPAKTYDGVTPYEIMQELAAGADKEFFVTVDNELAYFGHDYPSYNALIRISDDPADQNSTTFAPWDPSGEAIGRNLLTRMRVYYGTDLSQKTFQLLSQWYDPFYDYWEEVFWDSTSVTAVQAAAAARKLLDYRGKDDWTFSCSIGPLTGDDIYKLKPGQNIQFKARAARSGRFVNGTYVGDSFLTTRIRELRWTMPAEDIYIAHLQLERPRPTQAHNQGNQALTTMPKPPGTGVPNTYHYNADGDGGDNLLPLWDAASNQGPPGAAGSTHYYNHGSSNPSHWKLQTAASGDVFDVTGYTRNEGCTFRLGFYGPPLTVGSNSDETYLLSSVGLSDGSNHGAAWTLFGVLGTVAPAGTVGWALYKSAAGNLDFDEITVTVNATNSVPLSSTTSTGSVGTDKGCYALCDHIHPWQLGSNTPITDAGDYFSSTKVEGALQELGSNTLLRTAGAMWYGTAGSNAKLLIGASNTHLVSDGLKPLWAPNTGGSGSGFTNPMTTQGDLISGGALGAAQRLGIGASNTHLISDGVNPAWVSNTFGAVEALSAKASGTGDVTTTSSLADVTGASLSLEAGTYVVSGMFDTLVNNALNDRTFEGHLDVGGVDENDYAQLVAPGLVNVRATIPQSWRIVLTATTTIKLRTKYSGGTVGDFTVKSTNTTLTAYRAGGASTTTFASYLAGLSGLVHRWKFEEASGNFADSVGSLTLTASGTLTYSQTGLNGNCVLFGATGRGVSTGLGSVPVGATARTIVTVFKTNGVQTGKMCANSYGATGTARFWWMGGVNESSAWTHALDVWSDDLVGDAKGAGDGNWHLMAQGADGNRMTFSYLDGDISYRNIGGALATATGGNFFVGQATDGTLQWLGYLDDISVFSGMLSKATLDKLYSLLLAA